MDESNVLKNRGRTGKPFTAEWLAMVTEGRLFGNSQTEASGCQVDSRKILPGQMFIALKGEHVDGHDYMADAIISGATIIIAGENSFELRKNSLLNLLDKVSFVLVKDPLKALQKAALEYRKMFPNIIRIGVTGSSGKTTTKECLASILSCFKSTFYNPGNLNSEIGLPQSIFSLEDHHEICVFEMGINRIGEMDILAEILDPDHVIITNIGTAHIGIFGSRQQIALEKSKAFYKMSKSGSVYLWENDDFRDFMASHVPGKIVWFGESSSKGLLSKKSENLDGWTLDWYGQIIKFPLPGLHNLIDALAAIKVAEDFGASIENINKGLSGMKCLFGRTEIIKGKATVIMDCQNASPESVICAINFCNELDWRGRKIYVFGSMLELGSETPKAHHKLGIMAGNSDADVLFFYGKESEIAYHSAISCGFNGPVHHDIEFSDLEKNLGAFVQPGDLVLIKGSRNNKLERLGALFNMEV